MRKDPPKILRPTLARLIPRERVRRAFSSARAPVFWIEGVTGAGKTAAVSGYIESGGLPCIWLHLDRGDRDPATFFHYLSRAARALCTSDLPVFSPGRHELAGFGRHYFETLFGGLRPGTYVVLDELEQIEPSTVLELLSEAVARVPEGVVLLCLSRAAPPPSLARARASGRVCVLGWDALKLDLDETRVFSALFLAAPGDASARAEALYRISQGWFAGLVLLLGSGGPLALASADEPLPTCGPPLFDYLSVELYDRFEPDVARILAIAAIPPEVTDALAVELTGSERAPSVLASLAHRNQLVSILDGRQRSYRLHPLLRSLLLARGEPQLGAAAVLELRSRAALALAASGQPEVAAGLFIEAGDESGLVELIAMNAGALIDQGRHDVVRGWCQALSRTGAAREARVMFWEARALLPLDPPAAGVLFRSVYEAAAGAGQRSLTFAAWAGAVESILLGWGSFTKLDPWIDALPGLLDAGGPESRRTAARVATLMYSALICRRPDDPSLPYWEQKVRRLGTLARLLDASSCVLLAQSLLHHDLWRGNIGRAGALLDALENVVASSPDASARLIYCHMRVVYGVVSGDGDASVAAAEQGLALAERTGVHSWDRALIGWAGFGAKVAGDLAGARDYLRSLARLTDPSRQLELEAYHDLAAQLAYEASDLAAAQQHQRAALDAAISLGLVFVEAIERIGSADICHAAGQSAEAIEHLEHAERIAGRMDSAFLYARVALTRAHVTLASGQRDAGLDWLRRGLELSRIHGYDCLLRWSHRLMSELCERALGEGIETELVTRWIRRWRFAPRQGGSVAWPWPLVVYTLRGDFCVLREGRRITFSGKAQRRALELLQVLIAFGGAQVCAQRLCKALWPEADGDSARQALSTTLHRLGKLIDSDSILCSDRRLSLNPERVWVDSLHLAACLSEATPSAAGELALYQSRFLPQVDAWWAVAQRERLAERFIASTLALARRLELEARLEEAEHLLRRALETEPESERLALALGRHLSERGEDAAARDARALQRRLFSASEQRAR